MVSAGVLPSKKGGAPPRLQPPGEQPFRPPGGPQLWLGGGADIPGVQAGARLAARAALGGVVRVSVCFPRR